MDIGGLILHFVLQVTSTLKLIGTVTCRTKCKILLNFQQLGPQEIYASPASTQKARRCEVKAPRRLKVCFKVTLVKMHAARRSERGGRRTSGPPHAVLSPPTSPRPFEHSETPPQALAVWSSGGRCEEVAGTAPLKPIWDEAEDHELMCAVQTYGTLWPSVAARLPGRTADAVRNRWHRLRQQQKFIDPSYERSKLGAPLLVMPSPSTAAEFALPIFI